MSLHHAIRDQAEATDVAAMRMLVSVRSVPEALLAAQAGVDFIDLKEPSQGALGGLAVARIAEIVQALRAHGCRQPISATIGDFTADQHAAILARVHAVAACGVDHVKVGITPHAQAPTLLQALADTGHALIPVFIADHGLVAEHVQLSCTLGFPALMLDTADKRAGSLFDVASPAALQRFVHQVRAAGALAGLAGALRWPHLPALRELAPDFAGFRGAVCAGDRSAALDIEKLAALVAQLSRRTSTPPGTDRLMAQA